MGIHFKLHMALYGVVQRTAKVCQQDFLTSKKGVSPPKEETTDIIDLYVPVRPVQ